MFRRKRKLLPTTLPDTHGANYLNVPADPVVLYHPVLGQVVVLVPAPAPDFLPDESVFVEGVKCFDLSDIDFIPSFYYRRDDSLLGYVKT
jgi:hypothetical protein